MRRALAVEAEVRRLFADRGGRTDFDTTCDVEDIGDDSLAVEWEGSRETLGEAGGDPDSNVPALRRVEVEVEALQAATQMGGYSEALPLPAATTRWAINVDIVEGAQGLAGTWGKGMLRNRETGQTVRGGWIAGGGGGGIDIPVPSVAPGSWTDFETTNPVSFAAFEGSPIRLTSIAIGLGFGYGTAEFRFTDYMDDSVTISGIAFNQWGAGGSVTAGPWRFDGSIPAPPVVGVERPEEHETTAGSSHGLNILFATESDAIPADQIGQLEQFIGGLP